MTTLPSSDNNFYRNRVLVIKSVCNITFHDWFFSLNVDLNEKI
jgi:hypothetical protein